MEENNAIFEQPTTVSLEEENTRLREAVNQLYQRCSQLENQWLVKRAEFLFKVVESQGFSAEVKSKAFGELEAFLFPVENEPKEE